MSTKYTQSSAGASRRKLLKGAAATAGIAALGLPAISLAQNKPIRIGMPTILSESSRDARHCFTQCRHDGS